MAKRLYGLVIAVLMLIGWSGIAHAAGCGIGAVGTTQSIVIGHTGRSMLVHMPTGASGEPHPR